jgi:deoxyribose-phosphate aldolase
MTATTEEIIDAVTRQVLAAITGSDDPCRNCEGSCAAHDADKVRAVVANGASRVTFSGRGAEVPGDLAGYIDHTLLRPDATAADIDRISREAVEYQFASVVVNPTWVRRVAANVRGSGVAVASVVGFPLGANTLEIKAMEARRALREGASEIDMVINVGALKSGMYDEVGEDIARVSEACHESRAINKVILETALLTDEEKVMACWLAKQGRADYVKTSTGFGPGGATIADVALMRETVGSKLGVKASGGIRSSAEAQEMIAAGATRIGASAGVQMVTGKDASDERY